MTAAIQIFPQEILDSRYTTVSINQSTSCKVFTDISHSRVCTRFTGRTAKRHLSFIRHCFGMPDYIHTRHLLTATFIQNMSHAKVNTIMLSLAAHHLECYTSHTEHQTRYRLVPLVCNHLTSNCQPVLLW